ncbi:MULTISPECIES: hypothetical protein [unclassified Streptomyces]|nr:hypothetical protein [Streptomyces sp. CB09001]
MCRAKPSHLRLTAVRNGSAYTDRVRLRDITDELGNALGAPVLSR